MRRGMYTKPLLFDRYDDFRIAAKHSTNGISCTRKKYAVKQILAETLSCLRKTMSVSTFDVLY